MAKAKPQPQPTDDSLKVRFKEWKRADAAAKRWRAVALEANQKLKEATIALHEVVADVTGMPLETPLFDEDAKTDTEG